MVSLIKSNICLQVQLGKKDKKTQVKNSDTDKTLAVGDMCLLDVPKWADFWPLLGQVTRLLPQESKVEIKWWKSSLKGVCRPEMILKTKTSVKSSDWLEIVGRNQIWMFGFKLTAGNRFPKDVQGQIEEYDDC